MTTNDRAEMLANIEALLEPGESSADELAKWLDLPSDTVIAGLLELKTAGKVRQLPNSTSRVPVAHVEWVLARDRAVSRAKQEARPLPVPAAPRPAWWVGLAADGFTAHARREMESRQLRSTR